MGTIDLTLQGKGGVGKSFVASLLAQHFQSRGVDLNCYDTDPVNRTFGGYKAFETEVVRLGDRPDEVNPRFFDELMERIMAVPDGGHVVIDNGASTFLPLLGYMVETDALNLLASAGHTVRINAVLTGGQALEDTVQGLAKVLANVPDVPVIVWLNEYFGRVEVRRANGSVEGFEESKLYKDNKDRIHALTRLPEVRKETFGHDIELMMRQRLTFDEAVASEEFPMMARQRLRMTWGTLQQAMDKAVL